MKEVTDAQGIRVQLPRKLLLDLDTQEVFDAETDEKVGLGQDFVLKEHNDLNVQVVDFPGRLREKPHISQGFKTMYFDMTLLLTLRRALEERKGAPGGAAPYVARLFASDLRQRAGEFEQLDPEVALTLRTIADEWEENK